MKRIAVALALMAIAALALLAAPATSPDYKVVQTYKLGGEGGWDYLTFDTKGHRLFISRGTHVMVVDPDSGKVLGDIADTPGVHGIAIADDVGRGFTSNGREGTVTIFDLKTLQPIGDKESRPKTGQNPDAIGYDSASKRVFTFNGRSGDATAIEAADGKVAGTIPLGGKPETAAFDGTGKGFVNVEDKSQIVAFDTKGLKVLNTWSIAPCEEPSGLAIDTKHHRLFAGCHNKMMAVVNYDTGKVVATPAIGTGVDANGFDPGTQLAFSSQGDGTLTVVHEDGPDQYTVVQTIETARGARTMTLDPKSHKLYTVTADFGPAPAPTQEQPRPRPTMVPDSFKLLVIASDKLR